MTSKPPSCMAILALVLSLSSSGEGQETSPMAAKVHFNTYQSTISDLRSPQAVMVTDDDVILVAEPTRIRAFDSEGTPVEHPTTNLGGGPEWGRIVGLARAEDGDFYLVDAGNHCVLVYGDDGTFLRTIAKRGSGPGALLSPTAIAVDPDRVYVADTGNGRVQVFDHEGRPLRSLGEGSGEQDLRSPRGLAIDRDGRLFVADSDQHRVRIFDRDGQWIESFGEYGDQPTLLSTPLGLCAHGDEVFVADSVNHRISVYDRSGDWRFAWGLHALLPREGEGKLHYPNAVAIAPSGQFAVVVETFENRCQIFAEKKSEEEIAQRRDQGLFATGRSSHYGAHLAISKSSLVVLESGGHALMVYDLSRNEPILIHRLGRYGRGPGLLSRPTGLAFDHEREAFYVSDAGNQRLQLFRLRRDPDGPLKFDPFLTQFVKSLDLQALGDSDPRLSSLGPILEPGECDVGPKGRVYLLLPQHAKVLVLDRSFQIEGVWGEWGEGPGQLRFPADIAVHEDGRVFITDALNARVEVFDPQGKSLESFANAGEVPLLRPTGIVVEGDRFWVCDSEANRVYEVASNGSLHRALGEFGLGPGQFYQPHGIARTEDSRLHVMDFGNHRGLVLDESLGFQSAYGPRPFTNPANGTTGRRGGR